MLGYIIAGLVVALVHKAKAQGAPASGTVVTAGTPTFDVVSPKQTGAGDIIFSREPNASTLDAWQNGPMIPVPTGSRPDIFSTQNSHSDAKLLQAVGLHAYQGEGPQVINPEEKRATGVSPTPGLAASGGSGTVPGGGGAGGVPSGGGGFGGRALR